jgi:chromosome segregation ATPase
MSQAIATKDAVEAACSKIFAKEQRVPTYDEVARELKGGSNSTIARYLREWISKRQDAARTSLPPSIEARCLQIVQEVWSEATTAAAAALNGERLEVRDELRHAGAHIDELVAEIEALQKERERSTLKISELMLEVAQLKAMLQQQAALESENARLRQEHGEMRQERDEARVIVGRLQGQLMEIQRHMDALMATLPAAAGRHPLQKNHAKTQQTRRRATAVTSKNHPRST